MQKIRIKYFTDKIDKLEYIEGKSDWIDLRASETVELKAGEFKLIPLGVAMELPKGYEAHVVPRSSTFKNYGILQTNSCGIIDCTYCGDEDMWRMPVYATRDTVIEADVTGYELLGSEVLLYYTVAGVNMTARVDARTTAKIGDHIRLALDPEKIHVFDKESELTITN